MKIHHIVSGSVRNGTQCIGDRTARKGKTDEGNRRSDNDGGHHLVDPLDARKVHGNGNDDIYEPGKHGADQKPQIAHRHGRRPGERRRHRADKRKRCV